MAEQFERRMVDSTDDFDNILDVGYYFCYHSSIPSNAPAGWAGSGMLKVERYIDGGNVIYVQTIVSNSSEVYYRQKWADNNFNNWCKVTRTTVEYQ